MIRNLEMKDKEAFISMAKEFYRSDGVLHEIPEEHIHHTYEEVMGGSPFARIYIIDRPTGIAGYGLISLTYSNEAGGLVLWVEELFIKNQYRGLGLGSRFLDFIKKDFFNKVKRIRLELTENNTKARDLYIKKGFIPLEYQQMSLDY